MNRELSDVLNLGPKSAAMLAGAGITSLEQLRHLGPVIAFLAVRQTGQRASLNLLWAIAAGLQGRHWTSLSDQEKKAMRAEIEELTR